MLRLMESLVYQNDADTFKRVEQMAGQYVDGLKKLSADQLKEKKAEVTQINDDFKFLARFKIIPAAFAPKQEIEQIVQSQRWNPRPR
jgi:hypothetical protein